MYGKKGKNSMNFPDPLAARPEKEGKEYGIRYAKAISNQWGSVEQDNSLIRNRVNTFGRNTEPRTQLYTGSSLLAWTPTTETEPF